MMVNQSSDSLFFLWGINVSRYTAKVLFRRYLFSTLESSEAVKKKTYSAPFAALLKPMEAEINNTFFLILI